MTSANRENGEGHIHATVWPRAWHPQYWEHDEQYAEPRVLDFLAVHDDIARVCYYYS